MPKKVRQINYEEKNGKKRVVFLIILIIIVLFGSITVMALIPYLNIIKVSYSNNVFKIVMSKRKIWIDDLENILRALANIIKVNKTKEVV